MLSIIFLYSKDRLEVFHKTLECMQDVLLFDKCQKIVSVDHESNLQLPSDFEITVVPRQTEQYCWAHALNAGVNRAINDVFLYFGL